MARQTGGPLLFQPGAKALAMVSLGILLGTFGTDLSTGMLRCASVAQRCNPSSSTACR
jgi:TctA family transporter